MIERHTLLHAEHFENVPRWHASQRIKPFFRQMQTMAPGDDLPGAPVQRHGVRQRAVAVENKALDPVTSDGCRGSRGSSALDTHHTWSAASLSSRSCSIHGSI